ncbi:hypothetical protein HK405_004841 [Cladochytrium tenue]|nr:hypothetical protein HK405_004841 [Cladochytrium tenue]
MVLATSSVARLGVCVLAVYGVVPLALHATTDHRPMRRIGTLTGGISLALWAIGWTVAPNFSSLNVLLPISFFRNVFLGVALSIAAYVDALVLAATVTTAGVLRATALWGPVALEVVLAVIRGVMSVVRDSITDQSSPTYVSLNNGTFAVIAIELALAFVVSLAALLRLNLTIASGGKGADLLMSRWRFTIEVFVYAGGAFLVLILGLANLYDLATVGVAINAAEVQYVVRTLITWGQGGVDRQKGLTTSSASTSSAIVKNAGPVCVERRNTNPSEKRSTNA